MQPNLTMVLEQVGKDKGIDKRVLVSMLDQAILTAAKKVFGQVCDLDARFNWETSGDDLLRVAHVGEVVTASARKTSNAVGDRRGVQAEIGAELLFQIFLRPV